MTSSATKLPALASALDAAQAPQDKYATSHIECIATTLRNIASKNWHGLTE